MRVLVTGGSGYLGETVVSKLRERGDDVRVLDIVDNEDRPPEVELVRGDIRDPSAVKRALEGVRVVHHDVVKNRSGPPTGTLTSVSAGACTLSIPPGHARPCASNTLLMR